MRQSVYLALIATTSAIRISQTSQADCTWSTAGFSTAACDNGTAKCGSADEQTANAASTGKHSCDHTKALSQADCTWSTAGFSTAACDNGTAKCGSAAEQTANAASTGKKSCDSTKAL